MRFLENDDEIEDEEDFCPDCDEPWDECRCPWTDDHDEDEENEEDTTDAL